MGCYYCGEVDVSDEHVPPQCFFPAGQRGGLISVRSCDKHNSEKSKDDEYFRGVFLSSILVDGNPDVASQREVHRRALEYALERAIAKVKTREAADAIREVCERYEADPFGAGKAIEEIEERKLLRTGLFGLMSRKQRQVLVQDRTRGDILTTSFAFDEMRFKQFLNSVARALFFHETGRVWKGRLILFPHTFLAEDAAEEEKQSSENYAKALVREDAKGVQKTIFYYDIFAHADEESGERNGYAIGFCFFDAFHFTSVFVD